jgi:hypothetical protein
MSDTVQTYTGYVAAIAQTGEVTPAQSAALHIVAPRRWYDVTLVAPYQARDANRPFEKQFIYNTYFWHCLNGSFTIQGDDLLTVLCWPEESDPFFMYNHRSKIWGVRHGMMMNQIYHWLDLTDLCTYPPEGVEGVINQITGRYFSPPFASLFRYLYKKQRGAGDETYIDECIVWCEKNHPATTITEYDPRHATSI